MVATRSFIAHVAVEPFCASSAASCGASDCCMVEICNSKDIQPGLRNTFVRTTESVLQPKSVATLQLATVPSSVDTTGHDSASTAAPRLYLFQTLYCYTRGKTEH